MAKRRVKRKYTRRQPVESKLQPKKKTVEEKLEEDGVILNPAIAEPDSDSDRCAGSKEPSGEVFDEEEEEKGTLEDYVPKKIVYECPFCSNTQDELMSSDPTTGWCKRCGRAFPSNCIQV